MPFDGPLPSFDVRADFWSLRFVEERSESFAVRKNVAMPYVAATDRGVMATVYADGGYGYAATGDTSAAGLAAPRRIRVAGLRGPGAVAAGVVRPAARRIGRRGIRSAHRRLGSGRGSAHGHAPPRDQRRRRRDPALSL